MANVFKRITGIVCLVIVASGCGTFTKSTLTGAGVGAAAGGIAGSLLPGDSSSKPQNVLVGSIAGATLGALSGALIHKNMEDKERDSFEKGRALGSSSSSRGHLASSSDNSNNKRFVPPKVERRWVDDEIKGNVLVEAHYEQVIVEEGRWE